MSDALRLAFETGRPYTGLRGHVRDPALDALVPPDLARRLRVVALEADRTTLRVASAEPDPDLSALAEHAGGRRITPVLADRAEIDELLGPAPEPAPARPAPPPAQDAALPARHGWHQRWPLLLAALFLIVAAVLVVLLLAGGDGGSSTSAETTAGRAPAAPAVAPEPLHVSVTGTEPAALRGLFPRDAEIANAPDRPGALAAVCVGVADVAAMLGRPTGEEQAAAGCGLATPAEVTVAAQRLVAPLGGCIDADRAKRLAQAPGRLDARRRATATASGRRAARAAAARRADPRTRRRLQRQAADAALAAFDSSRGLLPVAVRGAGGDCVPATAAAIADGTYPLTTRAALVTSAAATREVTRRLTGSPSAPPVQTTAVRHA